MKTSKKLTGYLLPLMAALCLAALPALALLDGCASIAPGNDALVVNVERAETTAEATFDLVLNVDNNSRDLFRQNAPGFHSFCEWLRQPQEVDGQDYPRALAMVKNLDNIKLDYKAGKVGSNTLATALAVIEGTLAQAAGWLNVVTNGPGTAAIALPK